MVAGDLSQVKGRVNKKVVVGFKMIFIDCKIFWSGKTHLYHPKKSSELKCCQYHSKLIIVISTNHQRTIANIHFLLRAFEVNGILFSVTQKSQVETFHSAASQVF